MPRIDGTDVRSVTVRQFRLAHHTSHALFAWLVLVFSLSHCPCMAAGQENGASDQHSPGREVARETPLQMATAATTKLGLRADAEAAREWRKDKIRALWLEKMPEASRPTDRDLERILRGDFGTLREVPDDLTMHTAFIVNGTPVIGLHSVGMLLISLDDVTYEPWCSATLMQRNKILTALHCISARPSSFMKAYFPYEGLRDIDFAEVSRFCQDGVPLGCSPTNDDLAVVSVNPPYTYLPPDALAATSSASSSTFATIVGYGFNDYSLSDVGVLREGPVVLESCAPCPDIDRQICFDNAITLPMDIGFAKYDSGGPMYVTSMAGDELIGVASQESQCIDGEVSTRGRYVDVTSPFFDSWISDALDCNATCTASTIASAETELEFASKKLKAGGSDPYRIVVDKWSEELTVTMNHEMGSEVCPVDFHLNMPPSLLADCKDYRAVEVCVAKFPTPGEYEFSVTRTATAASCTSAVAEFAYYQLAAVSFKCPNIACWINARFRIPRGWWRASAR